jgi:hypothetical protein
MNDTAAAPTPQITGNVFDDLKNFHEKYGFTPDRLTTKGLVNRLQFLEEELLETEKAAYEMNSEELVDGLIDLIVVAAGTLDLLVGPDCANDAWVKVMKANHTKVVGSNDKRPNSEGMDLVKPDGWVKPDLGPESVDVELFFNMLDPEDKAEYKRMLIDDSKITEAINRVRAYADPEVFLTSKGLEHLGKVDPADNDREAILVLQECIDLLRRKGQDYQNPNSSVKAADYYPNGILDVIYKVDVEKRNRQTSLVEAAYGEGYEPNNEVLEDTFKDRMCFLAIGVELLRGKIDGQKSNRDMFNRPKEVTL